MAYSCSHGQLDCVLPVFSKESASKLKLLMSSEIE